MLEFARAIARFAERVRNPDPANEHYVPFVEPWAPSVQAVHHTIRRVGVEKAMEWLVTRAEASKRDIARAKEQDQFRAEHERKRREKARVEERMLSDELAPGRRIDRALSKLQLLSETSAANLEPHIRGSEHPSRILSDAHNDEFRKARSSALACCRKLEATLDSYRYRLLPPKLQGSIDDRLKNLVGYAPDVVALLDPEQGLPRQIMQRREALGLDPITGEGL
ncbi:hypothetical protein UFOVP952_42 [uncultured Caudovirales phage]|uniref:Uncharacterized protein n=1 Tax=uncultured Caudovirales phage TaxID=2100421 RepID=A0A6J7XFT0_9CAUD|nr:hypothetical protein UFOVP952_42 [uncultured Caudovirales phage]CAB4204168.1 hypothetical protein UFOVP1392_32 [uncultured Caudovirales phage]CAB5230015.1 hypothetical protein UFOVP1569_31 [uncultured Caudovirales phage]